MDLILSLMPIRLIRTLSRSTSEKILLGVLMALSLSATGVACSKLAGLPNFGKGDPIQATVKPSLLAKLEEQVGIIVSCLPCFKSPIERFLKRAGILKEHHLTRPSFVNTLPLTEAPNNQDQRNSRDGSVPSGKLDVVESADPILARARSNAPSQDGQRNKHYNAVWSVITFHQFFAFLGVSPSGKRFGRSLFIVLYHIHSCRPWICFS